MKKNLLLIVFCFTLLFPIFAQGRSATGDLGGALAAMDSAFAALEQEELTSIDEYYLGRAVTANILAIYRPYTANPNLTRYLNLICQVIAVNSPKPEIFNGYRVIILDTPELNAFASPGGHIMITKGLVEAAASEDMLAAVIAHEFAHIMLLNANVVIANMQFHEDMAETANRAAQLSASNSQQAARAVLFRNSITGLVDTLIKNGYSHEQEFEADTAAIMLLAASGYNPRSLIEMLRVMQQAQGSQTIGFASTHPSLELRINSAERTAGRYRVRNTSSSRASRFFNR